MNYLTKIRLVKTADTYPVSGLKDFLVGVVISVKIQGWKFLRYIVGICIQHS
jgi:hypothetical protein